MADNKKKKEYQYEISLKDGRVIYRKELEDDHIKSYEDRGHKVKKVEVK